MSLLLSFAAASLVAVADIDLASPTIFVSPESREAVASGTAQELVCFDVSGRSRKFRTACVTSAEWQEAVQLAEVAARRGKTGGRQDALLPQPLPSQIHRSR